VTCVFSVENFNYGMSVLWDNKVSEKRVSSNAALRDGAEEDETAGEDMLREAASQLLVQLFLMGRCCVIMLSAMKFLKLVMHWSMQTQSGGAMPKKPLGLDTCGLCVCQLIGLVGRMKRLERRILLSNFILSEMWVLCLVFS
jgi:hypothetical protein